MNKKRGLTRSQERTRIEGLRLLARSIARHYLEHPELYPGPGADRVVPAVKGAMPAGGRAVQGEETA